MTDVLRRVIGQKHWRTATLEARGAPEDRTVELSFSSETAVPRWFGNEILDHNPGAVRMERLAAGAPLLVAHDPGDQVGVVQRAWIDRRQKKGRATVRFGRSARAEEILQDVRDGIRTTVSVGYIVHRMTLEEQEGEAATYRCVDWEPCEISLAPVPADIAVGVGRNMEDARMPDPIPAGRPARIETQHTFPEEREDEASRIRRLGRMHGQAEFAETFVENGRSLEEFRVALLERVAPNSPPLPAPRDRNAGDFGIPGRDLRDFSLLRLVRAMAEMNPREAGLELAVCREAARALGHSGTGMVVPLAAFARRDVGAAGSALVGTDHLPGSFVDVLAPYAVTPSLATRLDGLVGNVSIPRATGATTGYWVSEDGELTESQPTFDAVAMSPKTVGGYTEVTYLAMRQSTPDVAAIVQNDLMRTIGGALDRAALRGGGSNEPTGILETAGIGSVTAGGSALIWEKVAEFLGDLGASNALNGRLAWIVTPAVMAQMVRTPKDSGSGAFVWEAAPAGSGAHGSIAGIPAYYTSNCPSNLGVGLNRHAAILGNFEDLLIGSWGAVELAVDTSTHFTRGRVRLRAMLLCDVAVRHPESFSACEDIDPAA